MCFFFASWLFSNSEMFYFQTRDFVVRYYSSHEEVALAFQHYNMLYFVIPFVETI